VAKLIVWAPDREQAISRMDRALSEFTVSGPGISTTIPLARRLLAHPAVRAAEHSTTFVDSLLQ
jgi:acetyl-CoA carboxylase, biotin carboxylase subunit